MIIRLNKDRIIAALQQEIKRQGVDVQLGPERFRFVQNEFHGHERTCNVDFVEIFVPDKE